MLGVLENGLMAAAPVGARVRGVLELWPIYPAGDVCWPPAPELRVGWLCSGRAVRAGATAP